MTLNRLLLALAGAGFIFNAHAATATLPKGVTLGPSAEGITEYHLPNGLKVLLFPDASRPTITVNMTYLVGSRHENYGETGMAHLLEHMMFKGASKNTDITQQFSARGMQFNGTTSLDRTNYYEVFQATGDNLNWALQMEADRMTHSFIARKDLDSEMTVVRNEFEKRREFAQRGADEADAERRLRLARVRPRHDRQPQRHRKRRHRQPAGLLSHLLPAG